MTEQREEGWYTDPYGRHEARWMSNGEPTKLVRDGKVTAIDPPLPDEAPTRVPEPIEHPPGTGGRDLRRADDAERDGSKLDHSAIYMRQMDAVWSDGAPPMDWITDGMDY